MFFMSWLIFERTCVFTWTTIAALSSVKIRDGVKLLILNKDGNIQIEFIVSLRRKFVMICNFS